MSLVNLYGTSQFSVKLTRINMTGVNIFHKPALMIKNHELIKRILLEDKSFFVSGDG